MNDVPAHVTEVGDGWWVGWYPSVESQESPSAAVFAEGVDRERALAIAKRVNADGPEANRAIWLDDPAGLGLTEIAHASGFSVGDLSDPQPQFSTTGIMWAPNGDELFGTPSLTISAWKKDPALSEILRAVVDGDVTEVRGALGATGSLIRPGADERLMRTWDEHDMTIAVVTSGLDDDQVDEIVESLRPATDDDWRDLTAQATGMRPLSQPGVQGGFADGYWTYTVEEVATGLLMQSVLIQMVDGSLGGGHSSSLVLPLGVNVDHTEAGTLLTGVVDPETARIVLTLPDGTTITPELHRLDEVGGLQVFGEWHDGRVDVASASAFDGNGKEHARTEHGDPPSSGLGGYSFGGTLID